MRLAFAQATTGSHRVLWLLVNEANLVTAYGYVRWGG